MSIISDNANNNYHYLYQLIKNKYSLHTQTQQECNEISPSIQKSDIEKCNQIFLEKIVRQPALSREEYTQAYVECSVPWFRKLDHKLTRELHSNLEVNAQDQEIAKLFFSMFSENTVKYQEFQKELIFSFGKEASFVKECTTFVNQLEVMNYLPLFKEQYILKQQAITQLGFSAFLLKTAEIYRDMENLPQQLRESAERTHDAFLTVQTDVYFCHSKEILKIDLEKFAHIYLNYKKDYLKHVQSEWKKNREDMQTINQSVLEDIKTIL